jgi:hypothetical protein
MSTTDSDDRQKTGRHPADSVVAMLRFRWSTCFGLGGRLAPDSLVAMDRITHTQQFFHYLTFQHPSIEIFPQLSHLNNPIPVSKLKQAPFF